MNVLILSNAPQKYLAKALKDRGHTYEIASPREFQMYISNNESGYDAIYRGSKPVTRRSFDAVIPRLGSDRAFGARLLRHFELNMGMFCLQSGRAVDVCADKWETSQFLSAAKVKTPKQFFCSEIPDLEFIVGKLDKLPVIIKPTHGSQGKGVIKLVDDESASLVLEYLHGTNQNFIIQQYVDTSTAQHGGQDIRIHVVGGEVINSMIRTAPKNKLRANVSLDAKGEPYDAPAEIKKMAIKAAEAIPGLNYAGIDFMIEPHPNGDRVYCIEVNSNPGTKIIDITGKNHFEDIVKHLEQVTPIFRRTWESMQPKQHTLPAGVEVRDIAYAFKDLENWICNHRRSKDETAFKKKIESLEKRNGEHGKTIVKHALEILEISPVKREWDWNIN
jgi:RimK family alpha-L-glutamate ligase